jgi:GT2 family glycosyltransferase
MIHLSVIVPTFNNRPVLEKCLDSWEQFASQQPVEVIVIEDGCKDDTAEYLSARERSPWGRRFLRWVHENDVNQVRCNNRGFKEARGSLFLVWDDDMFLGTGWFVPELIRTFDTYPEIGLLSLIRGLEVYPLTKPIQRWEDLHLLEHMRSTIGEGPSNWLKLTEVDIVIRPWVVRRACLDKVGPLDEAFCPIEWDEADLAYRIREGGWLVATHNYERLGAFTHLGSSTLGKLPSEKHKAMVLPNGQLFHSRWQPTIQLQHPRRHRSWWRRPSLDSIPKLMLQGTRYGLRKATRKLRGRP